MTIPADIDNKKQKASAWFRQLRDGLCAEFEQLEQQVKGPHADRAPGKFVREHWDRTDHSGAPGGGGPTGRAWRAGSVMERIVAKRARRAYASGSSSGPWRAGAPSQTLPFAKRSAFQMGARAFSSSMA